MNRRNFFQTASVAAILPQLVSPISASQPLQGSQTMAITPLEQADYQYLSIGKLSRLIREKRVSPTQIVKGCLARIERLNPTLKAFITVTAEQALKQAEEAEAEIKSGNWKGHLHGVPVAVKDMFDTAGIKTTAAFEHFKDRVPEKDAEVVNKLKKAGAIIIGKTNMHQLAMGTTSVIGYFGAVHNPWQTNYIAGGSSGGSAAALAAGLCYATIDTDAIGSCRLPASCCGVIGFKPTNGLISLKGILEGEQADETIIKLSSPAVMCRTVEDIAMILNVLADSDKRQGEFKVDYQKAFETTKNPRVGIVKNFKATDEVRTLFKNTVQEFRSLGYATSEIDVPFESASFDVKNIERDRNTLSKTLFKDIDILILPTTAETTPTIEEAQKREKSKAEKEVAFPADNTFFCNYYGLPAISVPCGFSKNGLPLGLQIVGEQWSEGKVLDIANRYHNETEWHLQHPVIAN
jgi:aspartyl-tRNA(Asn)/glutamyl-tRNA(Gln) amidotransferase subunit A